jgi:membrane-associated protein
MDLHHIADFFLHLDHHLATVASDYGTWTYLILFLIVFCETGLVVTPFLPGDSLLFVVGAMSAGTGTLNIWLCLSILSAAAILGNMANYFIGRMLSPRIFRDENIRFLNKEHLKRTQLFFDKYGPKTIIVTRFMPILRTCAPFLAGVGNMPLGRFTLYNIAGGLFWVFLLVLAGFFFGKIPIVEKNFSKVILLIIVVSLLPAVIEFWRHRSPSQKT